MEQFLLEDDPVTVLRLKICIPQVGMGELVWHKGSGAPTLGALHAHFAGVFRALCAFAYGYNAPMPAVPADRQGWDAIWEAVKNPR